MGEGFVRAFQGLLACLTAAAVMALIWIGTALSFGRSALQIAS